MPRCVITKTVHGHENMFTRLRLGLDIRLCWDCDAPRTELTSMERQQA